MKKMLLTLAMAALGLTIGALTAFSGDPRTTRTDSVIDGVAHHSIETVTEDPVRVHHGPQYYVRYQIENSQSSPAANVTETHTIVSVSNDKNSKNVENVEVGTMSNDIAGVSVAQLVAAIDAQKKAQSEAQK
jgi:hypothetical protein